MKINLRKLQDNINKDAQVIYESLNTSEAKSLYSLVVDLYEEINSFEKDAPPAAINALSPHLQQVQGMLENMLKEPLNYVSRSEEEESELPEEEIASDDEEDEEEIA
jgi:hypothetical protein